MKFVNVLVPLFLAISVAACSSGESPMLSARRVESPPLFATAQSADVDVAAAPAVETRNLPRVVILGDSLTAGYGLERAQSFPALLQRRLHEQGFQYDVVNAGVSGDTSAGGLRRLDWVLEGDVRVLVVALGGNDGLRGLPVDQMRRNLGEIVVRGKQKGAAVLLVGMEAPPNYGPAYTAAFRQAYRDVVREHHVMFVPFLLEGVAGIPALNIADGIHPNPEGARILERTIWRALEPVLRRSTP